MLRWAERARDAPGLITASRTMRCGEVADAIASRVARWADASLVAVRGDASVEHLLDLLAAIDAEIPALMLHPRWTDAETSAIVARARPSHRADGGVAPAIVGTGPRRTLRGALAIVATSGTTGTPKLAVLSRRAFVAAAELSAAHLGASEDDRWLLAMPLAHVGGLGVVARSLVLGLPIVLHEGAADPAAWIALAEKARVTHVSLVPTGLARWLERDEPTPSSLRVILLGGAACPESLLERAIARGLPIHPTYGLTETCGQVATAPRAITHPRDARALPALPGVELRVVDGTLRVRSPASMDGYLDATSPFDEAGFYDTGDVASLDDAGRLAIHARRTDLVVSGGENVYPREVEDALERVDGVRAACVFGVPDVVWGQRVAAAIVTDAGAPSDDVIVARARRELAGFKVPRLVARIESLSLGASGKLDRRATASRALPHLRTV